MSRSTCFHFLASHKYNSCLFPLVVDMIESSEDQSLVDVYDERMSSLQTASCCDYGMCIALTGYNDKIKVEMETLAKEKGK